MAPTQLALTNNARKLSPPTLLSYLVSWGVSQLAPWRRLQILHINIRRKHARRIYLAPRVSAPSHLLGLDNPAAQLLHTVEQEEANNKRITLLSYDLRSAGSLTNSPPPLPLPPMFSLLSWNAMGSLIDPLSEGQNFSANCTRYRF